VQPWRPAVIAAVVQILPPVGDCSRG